MAILCSIPKKCSSQNNVENLLNTYTPLGSLTISAALYTKLIFLLILGILSVRLQRHFYIHGNLWYGLNVGVLISKVTQSLSYEGILVPP